MTLVLAPTVQPALGEPAVGIFWQVESSLVVERTPLSEAEPYGECLTHAGGHYDRWENWQRLGAAGLRAAGLPEAIAFSEYDDWPRGRVVFDSEALRFMLYADRRLQRPEIVARLVEAFGLSTADVVVRCDPH